MHTENLRSFFPKFPVKADFITEILLCNDRVTQKVKTAGKNIFVTADILRSRMSEDEQEMYDLYNTTHGNRDDLFD